MTLKLGKLPARKGAIPLKFKNYANLSALPTPPKNFGFDQYVTEPWQLLGNDQYGDCVEAGAAHETMAWDGEAGIKTPFNDFCVLSDYSDATGFNPANSATDRGTDMVSYAEYRQKTGILDANGARHKIAAFLEIEPGNVEEMLTAAYIFGTVGIGIEFPQSAMDQFNAGEPWRPVEGSEIVGGHYIPFIRRRGAFNTADWSRLAYIITWGTRQGMTDGFFEKYCDEAIVYISPEQLTNGLTVNGFDMAQLQADLASLPT